MKTKKPLPKWAVPVLIGAGGLLVLVVGWLLVVSAQGKKAADLQKQTVAVQQQIATNLAAVAAAKSVTAAPQIRVADVYKLAQAMPDATDMPDLLLELNQTAKAAGVTLSSISPGSLTGAGSGYSKATVTLSVSGDFYSVTDLLYRLRNLVFVRNGALEATGRLFSVKSVSFAPTGREINASLSLDTYVYTGGSTTAAPAAPAVAPPASTDTTTTSTTTPSAGPSAAGAP